MDDNETEFDARLDEEEAAVVNALTPQDVTAIDGALLVATSSDWSKVAMVLAARLKSRPGVPDDVPLAYDWIRLGDLVERGDLDSRGIGGVRGSAKFAEPRRNSGAPLPAIACLS